MDAVSDNDMWVTMVLFSGLPGCGKSTLCCILREAAREQFGDQCFLTVIHKDKIEQEFGKLKPGAIVDKIADQMDWTAENALVRENVKCHLVFVDMNINPLYIREIMKRFRLEGTLDTKSVLSEVLLLHVPDKIESDPREFERMRVACIIRANSRDFDECDEKWSTLPSDKAFDALGSEYWGTPPSNGGRGLVKKGTVCSVLEQQNEELSCCVNFQSEEYPVSMLKESALENASGGKNECTGLPVEWSEENVLAPGPDSIKCLVDRVLGTVACRL